MVNLGDNLLYSTLALQVERPAVVLEHFRSAGDLVDPGQDVRRTHGHRVGRSVGYLVPGGVVRGVACHWVHHRVAGVALGLENHL